MIQRVLDRVIWQNFKVVQPVQTCRESFLIKSGVWMSSWGLIYWNGINAAQNQIQRLFDCKMLYLLQLVSTHQGPFSSIAVIMTKNYNDLNKDKIPKRNCIQVACSILISHSLPQVSLIPSIFTFCIKCLLYPNSYQYYPSFHHDLQCLQSNLQSLWKDT